MTSALSAIAMAILLTVSAGLGALWFAPATWLDFIISRATNEQVRLVQAQGRLWKGSGVLAVELGGPKPLTQNLEFELRPRLIGPGLSMRLSGQGLRWLDPKPEIIYRNGTLQVPAGQLHGPVVSSSNAASILGLAQVSAQINLKWPALEWTSAGVSGQGPVLAELNQISSALAPIRPLADLRVQLDIASAGFRPWTATATEDSVIMLSAQGDLIAKTAAGSLRCQRFCDYLNGMLLLLGRPSGEAYVFSLNSD